MAVAVYEAARMGRLDALHRAIAGGSDVNWRTKQARL